MLDPQLNDIRWPARLHAAARSNPGFERLLADLRTGAEFRDELGQHRATDRPLIQAVTGVSPDDRFVPADRLDEQLWSLPGAHAVPAIVDLNGAGPLHEHEGRGAIEVWTEVEFCGLHALFTLGLADQDEACLSRAINGARWHIEHTQPDNATNTPWGIHVFAIASPMDDHEGDLLAQALLHNSIVGEGFPDLRSALILEHAATSLVTLLRPTTDPPTTPG